MHESDHTHQFWKAYTTAAGIGEARYTVLRFGDSPELSDELAEMVLTGRKRATTSLRRDFTQASPIPEPGDFAVVVDGRNDPRCIIRTIHVEVKPMCDVDEQFASDEGGGDRSLAWWRSAHERYFKRQAGRDGFVIDARTEVVLLRFEVVWPPKNTEASWV